MRCRRIWLFGLALVTAVTSSRPVSADDSLPGANLVAVAKDTRSPYHPLQSSIDLDLDEVPIQWRDKVHKVVDRPSLSARGPQETFNCNPLTYQWLLDHPCEAAHVWRKLGAEVAAISPHDQDRFCWRDVNGSEIIWTTVVRNSARRVWFAEGNVKPGALMPSFAVKAVLVMHIQEGETSNKRGAIRHHTELALVTDSKAANLASKVLKGSAPKMAEQYLGQIEMFFAALAWYLDEFPDKSKELVGNYRDCPR